ncbi:MAG: hypothetical protein WA400_16365 [Silvibacterium sp.]
MNSKKVPPYQKTISANQAISRKRHDFVGIGFSVTNVDTLKNSSCAFETLQFWRAGVRSAEEMEDGSEAAVSIEARRFAAGG